MLQRKNDQQKTDQTLDKMMLAKLSGKEGFCVLDNLNIYDSKKSFRLTTVIIIAIICFMLGVASMNTAAIKQLFTGVEIGKGNVPIIICVIIGLLFIKMMI
jgi:hypothetical protein